MRRAIAVVAAFAAGCGVVLAAAVAYYFLPAPNGVLAQAPKETTYPVSLIDFADQRALSLVPTFSEGASLRATAFGTVTRSACTPGEPLTSGEVAFVVDGKPVVALAADVPFYRDLRWGEKGSDVDSLRRSLAALGYLVAAEGEFDQDLFDALSSIQETERLASSDGFFHLTDFMWMPTTVTPIATCEAKVGQNYTAGAPFATTTKSLTALTVASTSVQEAVPGERAVQIFGVDVKLPDTGTLTDPSTLAQIASAPEARGKFAAGKDGESAAISATSRLVTPLRVASVPPASVFNIQGNRGCVESGSTTYPVTIAGANLGMSLVTFEGAPPEDVLLRPRAESCGAG